ncbi:MAG: cupin domain-containing protein [Bacteroidales bacterium]|nr:cupin domain-containing protein [Bacteroidales bacterium]
MPYEASYWINKLKLQKHPEGGYFREVYRSGEVIHKKSLPERYSGFRNFSTSIYFLLESHDFSAFHRIKSDETWHFYSGAPITLFIIRPDGKLFEITLGNDPEKNQVLQFVVGKNYWFAAKVIQNNSYSLVGCTVAPGFDFDDFEMGKKLELLKRFPQHSKLIQLLTILE